MRVLINYATYAEKVTIHCLADDARTVIAPYKPVSSLETLYRLIKYVGGDPDQCRTEIKTLGPRWVLGRCTTGALRPAGDQEDAAVSRSEVGQIVRGVNRSAARRNDAHYYCLSTILTSVPKRSEFGISATLLACAISSRIVVAGASDLTCVQRVTL